MNRNAAYNAAERIIERLCLGLQPGGSNLTDLYIDTVLFGQLTCLLRGGDTAFILREFQEAYGEDMRRLTPAIREALAGRQSVRLVVAHPPGEPERRSLLVVVPPKTEPSLVIPAGGIQNVIPQAFVAALFEVCENGGTNWPVEIASS